MRRFLTSVTLASTVLLSGCPGPNTPISTEADQEAQAAAEQQAALMLQAVEAVADGQVNNAISGTITLPMKLGAIAARVEPGIPIAYLHAFRVTGELIREAEASLIMTDEKRIAFVVDKVPTDVPVVLAATLEPGIVLRAVVPPSSTGSPARKQVISTETEIIAQELAKLGVMPHVGSMGLGSVIAQGGLNPEAAADANELAAAHFEAIAADEWGQDLPEAKELADELRNLAGAQRKVAELIAAGGGNLIGAGGGNLIGAGGGNLIGAGGGNYKTLSGFCIPLPWMQPVCIGGQVEKKKQTLVRKVQEKRKVTPPPPKVDSILTDAARLQQAALKTDLAPTAGITSLSGSQLISAGGLNLRVDAEGKVYHPSGQIIGMAGSNLISAGGLNLIAAGGGNIIMKEDGMLYTASGKIIGLASSNLIAAGGGNIVGHRGGQLISAGGGNLIGAGGGNLIGAGGGNLIGAGGGNLIGAGGGNLIAAGGGNLIGAGGGNFKVLNFAGGFRSRLDSIQEALAAEAQSRVAPNGDPFTESQINTALAEGKTPYRTDCTQVDFDPALGQSCRVVVSPKGVHEVMVTRKGQSLATYVAEVQAAWEKDDTNKLDTLFKEMPALVNFVEHPQTSEWKSPIGTWRMRVVQTRGNDKLGSNFVLINDAEATIAQKGVTATEPLPSGPVSALLSSWFQSGSNGSYTDVLNNFNMRFQWKEEGRHLEAGVITGENRDMDGRNRTLYDARFSGQMEADFMTINGVWNASDNRTGGVFQMIRGPRTFTIPVK